MTIMVGPDKKIFDIDLRQSTAYYIRKICRENKISNPDEYSFRLELNPVIRSKFVSQRAKSNFYLYPTILAYESNINSE